MLPELADQPAHLHSLISTFAFCCLDNMLSMVLVSGPVDEPWHEKNLFLHMRKQRLRSAWRC